jgi:hypothetical protein
MAPDSALLLLQVRLTEKSVSALEAAVDLTGDTRTDAVNRAVQFYLLMLETARDELGAYKAVSDLGPRGLLVMTIPKVNRVGGFEPL